MKVSATAVPTVRWKWPGTNMVLCTTRFTLNEALTRPLIPPRAKRTIASACAVKDGVAPRQRRIQPSQALAAPGPAAGLERGQHREGGDHAGHEDGEGDKGVHGLVARRRPRDRGTGGESRPAATSGMKRRKASRARGSLKSFPPACLGSMKYHEMYAGRSQK